LKIKKPSEKSEIQQILGMNLSLEEIWERSKERKYERREKNGGWKKKE